MSSSILDYFNWNTKTSNYDITGWISSGFEQAYSAFPGFSVLTGADHSNSLDRVGTLAWDHKEWIASGLAIAVTLYVLNYLWNNRPQYPIVDTKSTLNVQRLSIEIPKGKPSPPNVTLTFCIDTSGSMSGEPEKEVKKSVEKVLNSAQKIIATSKGAKIEIAIVGFDTSSKTICEPTKINSNKAVEDIKTSLKRLESGGGTDIIAGLKEATTKVEGMAKKNRGGVHTFILLTDGNVAVNQTYISDIHKRLAAANAQLFAIGIGTHKKEALKQIAPETGSFKGTYIDTTLGHDTIESAIARIYTQAIASFDKLVLRSSQLEAGTWSVNNTPSIEKNKQSQVELETLSEGEKLVKYIKIDPKKLKSPLDLSKVKFDLTFRDPRGRLGKLSLPWNPNTTIDPAIVNEFKQLAK